MQSFPTRALREGRTAWADSRTYSDLLSLDQLSLSTLKAIRVSQCTLSCIFYPSLCAVLDSPAVCSRHLESAPAALSPPSPTERRDHPSRARAADSTHGNTTHNDRTLDIWTATLSGLYSLTDLAVVDATHPSVSAALFSRRQFKRETVTKLYYGHRYVTDLISARSRDLLFPGRHQIDSAASCARASPSDVRTHGSSNSRISLA